LHIRLRLPVVISPQTEKILSTNACEAGAARRSSASGASSLWAYEDLLKFSDVLNADIRVLDNIDSYHTDPYCNIKPTQT